MKFIGLTGGIGSGKTTVRKFFEKLGAITVDTDEIAHKKLKELKEVIIREFGKEEIVNKYGEIDRQKLGKIVFSRPEARRKLENILHPVIKGEVLKLKERYKNTDNIMVVEVPLLFEVGWDKLFDEIIVVKRNKEKRLKYLLNKGFSVEEAEKRINSQWPLEIKEKLAHRVIDNNGDLENVLSQVRKVWEDWKKEVGNNGRRGNGKTD